MPLVGLRFAGGEMIWLVVPLLFRVMNLPAFALLNPPLV